MANLNRNGDMENLYCIIVCGFYSKLKVSYFLSIDQFGEVACTFFSLCHEERKVSRHSLLSQFCDLYDHVQLLGAVEIPNSCTVPKTIQ